jgi:hypothetical protein
MGYGYELSNVVLTEFVMIMMMYMSESAGTHTQLLLLSITCTTTLISDGSFTKCFHMYRFVFHKVLVQNFSILGVLENSKSECESPKEFPKILQHA